MKNVKNTKFEQEYKNLNPKQKEAVDTIEGPVMVIAGPGTGKTSILTIRIANILRLTDTPISGILALTFTESGVKAMRSKLKEIIGDASLEAPIYTFHGFAMSIIKEFEEYFPHLSKSKNITEVESEKMIRKILENQKFKTLRPLGDTDYYVSKILKTISDAKREAWAPDMIENFAVEEIERIKSDEKNISNRGKTKGKLKADAENKILKCQRTIIFAKVYDLYEKQKKEEKKIDFDDMLFELLQGVRKNELLLRLIQEKYLYIMIDEHQDTNDTQNQIIREVASFFDNPNIFIVGDEKQAIYRFQGASVENFLSLQKLWTKIKIIQLEKNYRSHQKILDSSFSMIEKNYEKDSYKELRVKLEAKKEIENREIELIIAENRDEEEKEIINRLKKIQNEEKEKSVAVIVRKNSDVERIFNVLEESGLDVKAEKGINIFNNGLSHLYFSLLQFIKEPTDGEALSQTILGGLWGLDFKKQIEYLNHLKSGKIDKVLEEIKEIKILREEAYKLGTLEFLILLANTSQFSKKIETPTQAEVWRGIINLAKEIIETENIETPTKLIDLILDYKKTSERRSIKINTGRPNAQISVMTAHGSKGLEFDYIFLPYLLEEYWIRKDRGNVFVLPREKEGSDDIKDDRRLFFVGITRARKHIIMSLHTDSGDNKKMTPLRFIDELGSNNLQKIFVKSENTKNLNKGFDSVRNKRDLEKINYTKNVILEKRAFSNSFKSFFRMSKEVFL